MPDTKITALTAISTVNPATYPLPIVDTADTTMAASGTTKKITVNQILGAGGTATLASATITGDLTVRTNKLAVTSTGVGVNYATPAVALHVGTTGATNKFCINTAVTNAGDIQLRRGAFIGFSNAADNTNSEYLFANGGALEMGIAGSTAMTLNATGNVGIGVTPSAWATSASRKAIQLSTAGSISAQDTGTAPYTFVASNWVSTATGDQYILGSAAPATLYRQFNGTHSWFNAPSGTGALTFTQAMTLDASGNLLVRCTTAGSEQLGVQVIGYTNGNYVRINHNASAASGDSYLNFFYNATQIGSITQNGTTGVLYNIISDYRLKESVQPLVGGLARVNALKPSVYKWKSDGSNGEGFLAHELAEVVPFAVSGEKDALNEDGSIKSQGIDMSRVVPILVAAIQELTARVQTLETR